MLSDSIMLLNDKSCCDSSNNQSCCDENLGKTECCPNSKDSKKLTSCC